VLNAPKPDTQVIYILDMTLSQLRFVKAILLTKPEQNQAPLRILADCEQAWSPRDPVFPLSPFPLSLAFFSQNRRRCV
jgi:hypothetical protein